MKANEPKHDESNLMEITTKQTKPFKNLFDSLKDNIEDAILQWKQDGLHITASDHTLILATKTHLLADEFEHYYLSPNINGIEGAPLEIKISIRHLNTALQTAGNADIIHMIYNEKDLDYLSVVIKNEERKETQFSDIQISGVNDDIFNNNELPSREDYCTILKMPSGEFDSICKNLKRQNVKNVDIHYDGERLTFIYKVHMNRGRIIRDSVEDDSEHLIQRVYHNKGEDVFLTLNTSYIQNISKCAKIDTKAVVELCIDPNKPARFEFRVGTLGPTIFYLAPYIDDSNT